MLSYITGRLFQLIITALLLTLFLFLLFYLLPGDPVRVLVPRQASEQMKTNIIEKFGLEKPFCHQYIDYLKNILKGDFGVSFYYLKPVSSIIREHYGVTFRLTILAIIFEVLIGLSAAFLSVFFYRKPIDGLTLFLFAFFGSIPVFWSGFLAQYFIGLKLKILPISGIGNGELRYLIMPAFTLALVSASYLFRVARESMIKEYRQLYVENALAEGYPGYKVALYVFRHGLAPVITLCGVDLGILMSGAILTETIFNLPGLGRVAYLATLHRDLPLVMGTVIFAVIVFMLINLTVDLISLYLNPKLREEKR